MKLPKKCARIGLTGIKHDTRQEILNFLKFGNVSLSGDDEDTVSDNVVFDHQHQKDNDSFHVCVCV